MCSSKVTPKNLLWRLGSASLLDHPFSYATWSVSLLDEAAHKELRLGFIRCLELVASKEWDDLLLPVID